MWQGLATAGLLHSAAIVLLGAGLGGLILARPSLRGSTLTGPWLWSVVAVVMLLAMEVIQLAGSAPPPFASALCFAAACSTLCPLMSLLGAKRPQHAAWHLIVASLWLVAVLPAASAYLLRRSTQIELHGIRVAFIAILIVMALVNHLLTRFWKSACLAAAGQLLLFSPVVTGAPWNEGRLASIGALLVAAAILLAKCSADPYVLEPSSGNRAWLRFRDSFGLVWGLRVLERFNAAATKLDWPQQITWSGFKPRETVREMPLEKRSAAAARSFRMLLRRFVTPEWFS